MILEQYLRRRLSAPARENRESDDGCGGATHAGGHARCKAGRHGPTVDDNSTLNALSAQAPDGISASKANHVGNRLQPPFQRASRNTHFYLASDTPRAATLSNSTTSFRSPSRFLLNALFIVITIIASSSSPNSASSDRQTDSFDLGHEPTHPPTLFQAGSASASPTSQRLTGITSAHRGYGNVLRLTR